MRVKVKSKVISTSFMKSEERGPSVEKEGQLVELGGDQSSSSEAFQEKERAKK